MSLRKKVVVIALGAAVLLTAAVLVINAVVVKGGRKYILDKDIFAGAHTAIVLGAYVGTDGRLCDMLADRVETAVELYRQGKVKKLLMSGDHGHASYDEVNSMRRYAQSRGVPARDIFMDHAGFSTYDSMYRARDIFRVDSAVIVTQNFHLPRAVYIARKLGIGAVGISADRHHYPGSEIYDLREVPARVKAFGQVTVNSKPRFLGGVIPVDGDGRATHDLAE